MANWMNDVKVTLESRRTWRFRALDWLFDVLTKVRMHRTAGWIVRTLLTRIPVCYVRAQGSRKWSPVYADIRK